MTSPTIQVQVVSATVSGAQRQTIVLPGTATVADALQAAGVVHQGDVGIWGKHVALDTVLADGDRVELYRPLIADPKQARHRRASEQGYRWQGRTRRVARAAALSDEPSDKAS